MAEQEQEQNRSEAPTPYKLRRARERGIVARGTDLGFFAVLVALAAFLVIAGDDVAARLALLMRRSVAIGIGNSADPTLAATLLSMLYWPALQPVAIVGCTALLLVFFLEVVQLRGLVFSTHPLKPDFSRINPAKGLKRLFSMRILKEAFKNVFKMAAYVAVSGMVVRWTLDAPRLGLKDGHGLADAMRDAGMRLLFLFILLSLFFVVIDQIIVRREFLKQMRMSRRELTREFKEREGEPRIKQKRKQLHAEITSQTRDIGSLPGSDLLIVNPEHVAVALAYDPSRMPAPMVTAKARNQRALVLKREAFRLGIPIIEARLLARALFADCPTGEQIRESHYRPVADLYLKLKHSRRKNDDDGNT